MHSSNSIHCVVSFARAPPLQSSACSRCSVCVCFFCFSSAFGLQSICELCLRESVILSPASRRKPLRIQTWMASHIAKSHCSQWKFTGDAAQPLFAHTRTLSFVHEDLFEAVCGAFRQVGAFGNSRLPRAALRAPLVTPRPRRRRVAYVTLLSSPRLLAVGRWWLRGRSRAAVAIAQHGALGWANVEFASFSTQRRLLKRILISFHRGVASSSFV